MSSRLNPPEQTHKNRQLLALRKKYEPIEPIVPNSGHESPLLNTLALQPHHELPQHPKDHNLDPDQDFYLPQTNKIYHNSGTTRHLQIYRGSNQLKAPRASLNNLCKLEIQGGQEKLQPRPQSSQAKKNKMNEEIFKNGPEIVHQNRPGSSKSSRLFRQKGPFANGTLNSENQEAEPLIRVTGIGGRRAGTSQSKGSKRGGTGRDAGSRGGSSLSQRQKGGVEKLPSKIDPDFFRLFAK